MKSHAARSGLEGGLGLRLRFEVPCPNVFALLSQQHCVEAGLHGTS